jgi:hypothetical protein
MQMAEYFTNSTDAVTGETTQIPWTQEQIDAYLARRALMAAERGTIIPKAISQRQLRLFLSRQDMLATVQDAIMQQGGELAIEWEYAQEIARDHPAIPEMAKLFNLTSEQVDQFFIAASQL